MAFDPDKYLAKKQPAFDPDAYLAKVAPVSEIPRRSVTLADIGDRATGFRSAREAPQMNLVQGARGLRTAAAIGAGIAAGPALAVGARALGAAAPALQPVVAPLATAFRTGGFQSGLPQTAPAAARLASRVVGAAVPGAIAGGIMSPEEAASGAAISTGVALAAPISLRYAAKGAGYIVDALQGRIGDVRANQLVRKTIGDEVNALRQMMAAQPDVPASRIAAQMELPALQALLAEAESVNTKGAANAFRAAEADDIVNELVRISGGKTSEAARMAREAAKERLTAATTPLREAAFAAARKTGEVMPRLAEIAPQARAEAAEAVDRVRRFAPAVNTAERWANAWSRGGRTKEDLLRFPKAFAQRADEAAQESLRAGGRARAAENTLQSMKDRGLKPITGADLAAPINALLKNPDIATNREAAAALPRINQMLADWTNEFGVVTPEALYAIRKNGVAGVIRDLNPGMDAKAQQQLAASVLTQIKPLFDDAIEQAGGKGFRDYLKQFAVGMEEIENMALADRIRKLYEKGTGGVTGKPSEAAKVQLIGLLRGEDPQRVEKVLKSGRYKIGEAMSKDRALMQRIEQSLTLDVRAATQAAEGAPALARIREGDTVSVRFPFFTQVSTAINTVISAIENKISRQTMDEIIKSAQSGREFNRVLDSLPAKERSVFLAQFKNAQSWNKFTTEIGRASQAYAASQSTEE